MPEINRRSVIINMIKFVQGRRNDVKARGGGADFRERALLN